MFLGGLKAIGFITVQGSRLKVLGFRRNFIFEAHLDAGTIRKSLRLRCVACNRVTMSTVLPNA